MAKKYKNDFKVMIVELLKTDRSVKEVSDEYRLNDSMLRGCRIEYEAKA
jgi:transposase